MIEISLFLELFQYFMTLRALTRDLFIMPADIKSNIILIIGNKHTFEKILDKGRKPTLLIIKLLEINRSNFYSISEKIE